MSYTVATPVGKSRPTTVTVASALLFVCAAVQLISLVLTVVQIGPVLSVLSDEFAGQAGADTARMATMWGAIGGSVVSALFAIGTLVLGLLVRKGKNPARIVTFVLSGIAVLCYGCSLGGTALSSTLNGIGGSTAETEQMTRRMTEAVPSWLGPISTTATVISLLAFLAIIVLLALPASNEFFRKEQEVWVPPTWPGDGTAGSPPPPPPAPTGFAPPGFPPVGTQPGSPFDPPATSPTPPPAAGPVVPPSTPPGSTPPGPLG